MIEDRSNGPNPNYIPIIEREPVRETRRSYGFAFAITLSTFLFSLLVTGAALMFVFGPLGVFDFVGITIGLVGGYVGLIIGLAVHHRRNYKRR